MRLRVWPIAASLVLLIGFNAYGKEENGGMKSELQGYWIPGDFGTRVEISGDEFLLLWQNKPVLKTTFTVEEKDGSLILHLAESGMRYSGDAKDYGTVKECRWHDGAMYFTKFFPITGDSPEVLHKTENSRYGNVDLVNEEILPLLQGAWKADNHGYELKIEGSSLQYRWGKGKWEKPVPIAVVKSRSRYSGGVLRVVNADPAQRTVGCFIEFTYTGGTLETCIPVCDADAPRLVFRQKKS